MPAGHLLSEGQYINRNVSEDELWSVFSRLFSAQSKIQRVISLHSSNRCWTIFIMWIVIYN